MNRFECENEREKWIGEIKYIKNYGSHYEMYVEGRSGLLVIFGEQSSGNFLCIPNFNVGSELSHLTDRFWNTERLTPIIGEVDAITIAEALYEVNNLI